MSETIKGIAIRANRTPVESAGTLLGSCGHTILAPTLFRRDHGGSPTVRPNADQRSPRRRQRRTRLSFKTACLCASLMLGSPLLGQSAPDQQADASGLDSLLDEREQALEAFLAATDAYNGLAKSTGFNAPCDLRQLCNDERFGIQITPDHVRLIYYSPAWPSTRLASFPVSAIHAPGVARGSLPPIGTQDRSYLLLQRSMALLDKQAAGRTMLYRFPNAQDNPFLPWPPRTPSSFEEVTGTFKTDVPLGNIAQQIRWRITPRGYDSVQYFSVPGGFAMTTDLERVGRGREVKPADRWTRGKLGGYGSMFDYWKRLLAGEDDRFRVFVFIITDDDIPAGQGQATQADLESWKATGRPALSRNRADAKALAGTRIWLYTYEFNASRSKGAQLIQNNRDPIRAQQNRLAVGLP